jgi:tRNA A37 N6-isopentenylltransferase MiaA
LAGPDARGPKGSLGRVPGDGPARSRPDSKSSRQGEGACGNVKVLVIVGPTGVGKTEVACLVAREIGGEIVSADSRQMYRGLDIGTDKPDRATLKMIPHHMVDVLDPAEQFDAARFAAMARDCFEEISARGKVPILVGGSGLYVKAALYGLFQAPSRDEDLRARLLKEEERRPGGMHARLVKVDPDRASELDRADLQRIVRALEFYELTGVEPSELAARGRRTCKAARRAVPAHRRASRRDDTAGASHGSPIPLGGRPGRRVAWSAVDRLP